jgi:uncharacterized membrane protein YwzB
MFEFLQDPIGFLLVTVCFWAALSCLHDLFSAAEKASTKQKVIKIVVTIVLCYVTNQYFVPIRAANDAARNMPCYNIPSEDMQDCLDMNK